MEYIDVLDSAGKPTGQSKSRAEIHRDGDWHRMAFVWVLNNHQELLLQKRSLHKDAGAGLWDVSAGGHVESGETALQAARKELLEELGIEARTEQLEYLFSVKEMVDSGDKDLVENQLQEVYLLQRNIEPAQMKLQPEEVDEVEFVPFRELEVLINKKDGTFTKRYELYKELFIELHKRYG